MANYPIPENPEYSDQIIAITNDTKVLADPKDGTPEEETVNYTIERMIENIHANRVDLPIGKPHTGNGLTIHANGDGLATITKIHGETWQDDRAASKNLCPGIEEWTLTGGSVYADGAIGLTEVGARAVSPYIPLDPTRRAYTTFQAKSATGSKYYLALRYYDIDKVYISDNGVALAAPTEYASFQFSGYSLPPQNAAYVTIRMLWDGTSATDEYYVKDFMLTQDGYADYEPFVAPLGWDYPRPLFPVKDIHLTSQGASESDTATIPTPMLNCVRDAVTGNIVARDSVDAETGEAVQEVKYVELDSGRNIGSGTISSNGFVIFTIVLPDMEYSAATTRHIQCSALPYSPFYSSNSEVEAVRKNEGSALAVFSLNLSRFTNQEATAAGNTARIAEFKQMLDAEKAKGMPVQVVVKLAEPVTTPAPAETIAAMKAGIKTFKGTTVIECTDTAKPALDVLNYDMRAVGNAKHLNGETIPDILHRYRTETTGTASAYEAAVEDDFSYTDGQEILIKPHADNANGATLNVNGLGAAPIYGTDKDAIVAGDLPQGQWVKLIYTTGENPGFFVSGGKGKYPVTPFTGYAKEALSKGDSVIVGTELATSKTNYSITGATPNVSVGMFEISRDFNWLANAVDNGAGGINMFYKTGSAFSKMQTLTVGYPRAIGFTKSGYFYAIISTTGSAISGHRIRMWRLVSGVWTEGTYLDIQNQSSISVGNVINITGTDDILIRFNLDSTRYVKAFRITGTSAQEIATVFSSATAPIDRVMSSTDGKIVGCLFANTTGFSSYFYQRSDSGTSYTLKQTINGIADATIIASHNIWILKESASLTSVFKYDDVTNTLTKIKTFGSFYDLGKVFEHSSKAHSLYPVNTETVPYTGINISLDSVVQYIHSGLSVNRGLAGVVNNGVWQYQSASVLEYYATSLKNVIHKNKDAQVMNLVIKGVGYAKTDVAAGTQGIANVVWDDSNLTAFIAPLNAQANSLSIENAAYQEGAEILGII